jgi:hypothetical protein
LISIHQGELLEKSEFNKFILDQRVDDLRRLYDLFKKVKLHLDLKNKWVQHLKQRGEQILKDE